MSETAAWVLYEMFYIIAMIIFVMLGCYMLAQRGNAMSTRGELLAKQRMTRTMGIAMFAWAFENLIYLPPMLYGSDDSIYFTMFNVVLMVNTPVVFNVMFAVVQREVNMLIWDCALAAPFLFLAAWSVIAPDNDITTMIIGAAIGVVSMLLLLIMFAKEYRMYVCRLQSEYSEISGRNILWAWISFSAYAVQSMLFVAYQLLWSMWLDVLYVLFAIINATCLCFCISRQIPLDHETVQETKPDNEARQKGKEFYVCIEEKLESCCKNKLLFLDPNITLETLSLRLAINRTYLGMYFHSRELTFYQYINTLRVEYACQLMQDNPDMSIRSVSEQSGFRSQTTFRKVFREVMGCLPSEMKIVKN